MIEINNDIEWKNVNWTNTGIIICAMILFLVSIRLMVGL